MKNITYLPMKMEYYSSYLPAYEDGTDRVFRNVGIQNSDAGELPRRKQTTSNLHLDPEQVRLPIKHPFIR
jgi:hypothetical protein